jgi:predicted RNase H-like HicB family nuclease
MKQVKVIVEWSDGNFSAGTGEVNGAVIATGATLEKVKQEFKEAFNLHVKGSLADGDKLPAYIVNGQYGFDFDLQASAMLHLADGLITRSALSRVTGINEKQLSHYLTGHRKARQAQNDKIAVGIKTIEKQIKELSEIV